MSHIYVEYVLNVLIFYLSPSLQKNMEEQLKGEEKKSHEDLRFYLKEKRRSDNKKKKKKDGSTQVKSYIIACDYSAVLSHLLICCMSEDHMSDNYQPVQFFWDEF